MPSKRAKKQNLNQDVMLDINLKNLNINYKIIKKLVSRKTEVAATVKANGYGLGAEEIVKSLTSIKCKTFFVATLDEGIQLRSKNKLIKIQVLNGLNQSRIAEYKKFNLIPIINNLSQLRSVEQYSKNKSKINITIHFDTGMSRLGLDEYETKKLIGQKNILIKYSKLQMIMSHLSCGDDPNNKKNEKQLKKFQIISNYFPHVKKSLSNSAGILLGRKYDFDLVRPGISLYGGNATIKRGSIYKNVVSLKAKIIQTRKISQFDTVGYGATFKAKKEMLIGTIPIGYADGFFRAFSGKTNFYFKKSKIKMIGKVSMDLITVDLSKYINITIKQTDYVEIINEKNNINLLSKIISTIPYEILTSLGNRYQRRYIA